jgi:glyoxylase-like metal-dependent hydrolase (beta-lactamase superfamily II)
MRPPAFPPQLHVFVRDWLSANNVVLRSRDGDVVVDTGHVSHAPLTLALVASRQGLDGGELAKVVNTHCHSDHMGGNAALARAYGCPIAVPAGEAPLIERWDGRGLWLDYAGQCAERFAVGEILEPGSIHVWGDLEWRAIAAPGHDMGALVFYNPEHRILISGDAIWENGYGVVLPPELDPAALPAARATLETLGRLDVRVVVPGHGEPFTGFAAAIDRALARTAAFEADPLRVARHALKVMLTFTLLERRKMAVAELPAYVDRVEIYRALNALYFRTPPERLAETLVAELEKAGAVRRSEGFLVPA